MRQNVVTVDSPHYVASLDKGIAVLTCFGRQTARLTPSDVARLINVSPASARRSLLTLEAMGYLESDGKRFQLAPKVLLMAHGYLSSRPLPSIAQPLLDTLSERTKESASVGQWLGNDVIIVGRSTARRCLSTGLGVGSRLPGYCSALGRALLAGLPQAEARSLVRSMDRRALTERTAVKLDPVETQIARCRERGFSSSDGEIEPGVRSIAVPVRDGGGKTIAAMSISVRAERLTLSDFEAAMAPLLKKCRDQLESRLNR